MDQIEKFLKTVNRKEKIALDKIVDLFLEKKFGNLDLKKLSGAENCFRIRKGRFRIIFYMERTTLKILSIERKSDNTYN